MHMVAASVNPIGRVSVPPAGLGGVLGLAELRVQLNVYFFRTRLDSNVDNPELCM